MYVEYGGCRKGFSVTHLNIRSVKSKVDELHVILNSLKPTVLTLSETWLTTGTDNSVLAIDGYDLYRADRITTSSGGSRKRGGGLATYLQTPCIVDAKRYANLMQCNDNVESQILVITKGQDKGTVLINIYRPPKGSIDCFLEYISQIITDISRERYRDIYLHGNLNLDHSSSSSKKTDHTRSLQSQMKMFGFNQLIKKPTRKTTVSQTIIDVIYVRTNKKVLPFVLTTSVSDHFLVGCTRYLGYTQDPTTHFYGRSYRNYSYEIAEDFYATVDRSAVFQITDVDLAWKTLRGFILKCIKCYCPERKVITKCNQPSWINNYILETIADRDAKFVEAYSTRLPGTLREAKNLRTVVKKLIRKARADYIQTQLNNANGNPRKFWAEINSLLSRKKKDSNIILHDSKGQPISPEDTPGHINDFFLLSGPTLLNNLTLITLLTLIQLSLMSLHRLLYLLILVHRSMTPLSAYRPLVSLSYSKK